MVWGGFFKIRILSIFRMHAAGDFIVVYHIWFIMYDIVLWVRVGFLHKDDRHLCCFRYMSNIYAGSHVPNEKSTLYMLEGIISTKIYTLWLSPESIRSSVLIERLIIVALWPWAIDACRDPWRWKRPWWIGKEGKSCSRWRLETLTPRILILWLFVMASAFLIGGKKWCGGSPGGVYYIVVT